MSCYLHTNINYSYNLQATTVNADLLHFLATPRIRAYYLAHAQISPSGEAGGREKENELGRRRRSAVACYDTPQEFIRRSELPRVIPAR